MAEEKFPIPLNLDWDSPEGKRHNQQMADLPPDDPVAIAHFKNIGKPHPTTLQPSWIAAREAEKRNAEAAAADKKGE